MGQSLKDRVVIITGASAGIGQALALACSRRGARVVLSARSEPALQEGQRAIIAEGGRAIAIRADVTSTEDIQGLIEGTLKEWGRIDVLVNNAGFGLWAPFDQLPLEELRRNFETNVFGAVACSQAVIPHMRKQGHGLIVNIESIVALRAMPVSAGYSASKHALHAFSEAMRVELAAEKIRVLSVCPGLIATSFHKNRVQVGGDMDPAPQWLHLSADVCALKIVRAMESNRSQIVVAGHAKLLAIAQRISPRFLDWFFAKFYRCTAHA